jgi:hypothetical protein
MLICYFLLPPPPPPADDPNLPVNVNYVYGLNEEAPQEWMPPLVYLGLMMVGMPVCVFLPTHLVLRWAFPERPKRRAGDGPASKETGAISPASAPPR